MNSSELESWLRETDPKKLQTLWNTADEIRREAVGDEVHLRGLIELSNVCRRKCSYCGVNAANRTLSRYRMSPEEIMDSVRSAVAFGYGSIVMQAGEDSSCDAGLSADVLRRIARETRLAITLSLGERDRSEWELWKSAGADRYLLRFETSNVALFNAIHPPHREAAPEAHARNPRIAMLETLRSMGYEIGSGIMVGIPGQSYRDVVGDLLLFRDIPLDMIGLGPFLPHPETVLGRLFPAHRKTGCFAFGASGGWSREQITFFETHGIPVLPPEEQMCVSGESVYIVMALARILVPRANIPTTTALASVDADRGRIFGLQRGANVVMPNLTPQAYRKFYEIYPNKSAVSLTPEQTHLQVLDHIRRAGRVVATGRGDSKVSGLLGKFGKYGK